VYSVAQLFSDFIIPHSRILLRSAIPKTAKSRVSGIRCMARFDCQYFSPDEVSKKREQLAVRGVQHQDLRLCPASNPDENAASLTPV
jgi:hypothetical protein